MNVLKRTSLFLLLCVLAFIQVYADALSDFTGSRSINAPKTSVLVIDIEDGSEILSHNAELPLIPASIMKCVTTATLLEKTGSGFRYETPVYYTGNLEGGVIDGNIVVEASGDPSLNSVHDPESPDFVTEIVDVLLAAGVREVKGSVVVDEERYPGPAVNPLWASGDLGHSYGTGTHGFNFEDNASGKRSVSDPAAIFRSRLRAAAAAAGISIGQVDVSNSGHRHRLGRHRSATVDEIMRSCMMRSDNQFAEAMLRKIGEEYGGEGSVAKGASEESKFWKHKKADMKGVSIYDGSGLSRSNRLTARFMADVLMCMADNPYYASFFPLAGQEGTLKRFLAGSALEGLIALKTGSMSGIQCYAGYKLDENYAPTHVVVVMMNDMANRTAARSQVETLLLKTFDDKSQSGL